jgi:hypothetical protein
MCKKISGPPFSSTRNPKPRSAFHDFKVPAVILFSFVFSPAAADTDARAAVSRSLGVGLDSPLPFGRARFASSFGEVCSVANPLSVVSADKSDHDQDGPDNHQPMRILHCGAS